MKFLSILTCLFFVGTLQGQKVVTYDSIMPLENYNFVLGTNCIGGKYRFTSDSKLFEQAKHVRAMGSNILKISLGPNSLRSYDLKVNSNPSTTLELFKASPEYKKVFDMDFKYILAWVHTATGIDWKNGINKEQEKVLYDEMYNLVTYLLKEYNNTGKTFLIGNWEGDWMLHPNYKRDVSPTEEHIQNMTKWFQIRQKAIDDAKKSVHTTNLSLFYYVEVNLVLKGMKGENCIAQRILPEVNPDLVSYSSYEAIKNRTYEEKKSDLEKIFNYLEHQLKPKGDFPFSRRVFIGEYGYHANIDKPESFTKQFNETKEIMKISLELNLPFALHWQMYNNEYENGVSKQMSLINESGERMPLYFLHKNYYRIMNNYLIDYKNKQNKYPSQLEFTSKAIAVLNEL